jgi:hypothetical protein
MIYYRPRAALPLTGFIDHVRIDVIQFLEPTIFVYHYIVGFCLKGTFPSYCNEAEDLIISSSSDLISFSGCHRIESQLRPINLNFAARSCFQIHSDIKIQSRVKDARFEVYAAVKIHVEVFRVVTPCSVVVGYL